MNDRVVTICDECFEEVEAEVKAARDTVEVRGVEVTDRFEQVVCPKCGSPIGYGPVVDRNFERMYRGYREACDIPQPEDIVALRQRYGLSQRVFAAILGLGVASVQRYEQGSLPSESHAELLRRARDPRFLLERLQRSPRHLSARDIERATARIESMRPRSVEYAVVRLDILDAFPRECTLETGMRLLDADRLRETVVHLAAHIHDLYQTKLNKALFYLDFASYRDLGVGFTGLRYARADFGPVPDRYELLAAALADGESLESREQGDGHVFVARRGADLSRFTPDEVALLGTVAAFVDAFPSSAALSARSHEEDAWVKTVSGGIISYEHAATLSALRPPA